MPEATLSYEERGEGAPVVLVHGFPFDCTIWRAQLDEVSKEARVLAPDLPGFGGSRPLRSNQPTMDDHASRIIEWANELGLGRFVLVGHSMGGYAAFALARLYPERVSGLGLVCTRPGPDSEEARQNRYNLINAVREKGPQAVVDSMLPKLLATRTKEVKPEIVERVREIMLRQEVKGIVAALRAMATRPDSSPLLADIRVPTLVVKGAEDTIIPSEEADLMASTVPGARLEVIESAAHMPMLERPDELNEMLRDLARSAQSLPDVPEPPDERDIAGVRRRD